MSIFPPVPVTKRYASVLHIWSQQLQHFYDKEFVLQAVSESIKLGIDEQIPNIEQKLAKNRFFMEMSHKQHTAITEWVVKGVNRGYIAGPFILDFKFPFKLHTSPLFVVPKPKLDEWRTISHASYRGKRWGFSVNDLIRPEEKKVQYVSVKEIVRMIKAAGKNAWIWVVDAEDAYYRLPVHQSQYKYLGLKWLRRYWVFLSTQMGIASAPRAYTRFADAVEYIIVNNNREIAFAKDHESNKQIQLLRHYLDDFFGAHQDKQHATRMFNATKDWFDRLNIPTREDKCKEPTQSKKIIGGCYDTRSQSVKISQRLRHKALVYLYCMLETKCLPLKAAQILRGVLGTAAQFIFPAKTLLRRFDALINDPRTIKTGYILVDAFLSEDAYLWLRILVSEDYVVTTFDLLLRRPDEGDFKVFTDASGGIGIGGCVNNQAFQVKWEDTSLEDLCRKRDKVDIQVLELLGTLVAIEL